MAAANKNRCVSYEVTAVYLYKAIDENERGIVLAD